MEKAEIRIVINTDGFDRTEVLAPKSNPELKDSAMKTYGQIAFEIYKFRQQVNQILGCSQEEAEQGGIHIYS